MSSAFWLLLYLAPLLALTAAVFGWLGWRWRGSDLRKPAAAPEAALTASETPQVIINDASTETEEANRELETLRETLKAAQSAVLRSEQDAAKAREASVALEAESQKLIQAQDLLRTERDRARSDLAQAESERERISSELSAAQNERDRLAQELAAVRIEWEQLRARPEPKAEPAPAVTTPATVTPPPSAAPEVEKPKRKRTTASKPRKPAPVTSLREKITALTTDLAARQSAMAALTQEHADWQRRVGKLEAATPGDPAGLGLARRSLADSEKRLQTASAEVSRLQNQTTVLQRVEEHNATLTLGADDDLTQIKGIKKVISEQLHAHGIRTWRQIARWNDDEMNAFSDLLAFKNRASREKWREQARALHEAAHGPLP
ncbi:MAG: hypothetical protein IAE77_20505 [Prosthecobacter sp.]|jgi:predicted flap endonuclease-1-like 5' DNA nuclease|uniref:hypothetical protein n=1 Tax=Prosthecobacter sp. TaxID=1965333 RepID=UPI0019FAA854|nr:hypothetical protein [Prosthecobacter sp.]MBE2285854.1 hypothetical protein [Prosthecobacter sp.]